MPDDILDLADRLWRGEVTSSEYHPVAHRRGLAEVRDGVAFLPSFANVTAFTTEDGLVLVDTGSSFVAAAVHDELRRWSGQRLNTAVYSHGHIDHTSGMPPWEAESAERGWPAPVVVAHEALPRRFDRYLLTTGYNEVINQRQFGARGLRWPTEYRYPDRTYSRRAAARSRRRRVPAAAREGRDRRSHGHLAGRPEGAVLRRPVHLGVAERGQPAEGAALPEGMGRRAAADGRAGGRVPAARARPAGHRRGPGPPGPRRHRRAARGARRPDPRGDEPRRPPGRRDPFGPAARRPGSQAVPAAGVRRAGVHRPQHLAALRRLVGREPGHAQARARARAGRRASPPGRRPRRARRPGAGAGHGRRPRTTAKVGDAAQRLAGHLAELAWLAAPDDNAIAEIRRQVFAARADAATSTMARGIFRWAADESS